MTIDYDKEFGPNGRYAWPDDVDVAENFMEEVPSAKSSADGLDDDFFYRYVTYRDGYLFREYPEEEAWELVESAAKSRQELFKDATEWPLPYLVTSAVYKILSAKDESVYMISRLGDYFFWSFLSFNQPLFDVLQSKGWGKVYGNEMRKGFHDRLSLDIGSFTVKKLVWGSDEEKSWFTCKGFTRHIYPDDVLRCLDLVGIDRGLAQFAVDQVFKSQSLTHLCDVLSDNPSSTSINVLIEVEEGKAIGPNKPAAGMQINVLKLTLTAFVVAGAVIASNRLRLSPSKWASTRPISAFTEPSPCFAATRRLPWNRAVDTPLAAANQAFPERHESATGAIASASKKPRSQRLSSAFKNVASKLSRTKSPDLINTRRMWRIANALQTQSAQSLTRNKSAAAYLRQTFSDVKTEIQKVGFKLYEIVINSADGLWVNGARVFTEGSPEVIELRSRLEDSGRLLPDGTSLCIHVQRTPDGLNFTIQGTRTEFNSQGNVMKWIAADFLVDSESVVQGAALEIDHIWGTKVANVGSLRSSTRPYDTSYTVRLTPSLHRLRTNYFRAVKPKYNLGKLTQPLSEIVKSMAEADKNLWSNKKHRPAIFRDRLTPKFLLQQYADGHRCEVSRMSKAIEISGFSSRQATAYVADEVAREGIAKSTDNFLDCRVSIPILKGAFQYDREGAARCYREKVRQLRIIALRKYFSNCIGFLDDFETYAYSQAGAMDGCTASQVRRHRDTKIEAIYEYRKALKNGFQRGLTNGSILQKDLDNEVNLMLAGAKVDKDGNPTAIPLATEALKARIKTRGDKLHMDSLYLRDNAFDIKGPEDDDAKKMYEECVKSEARKAFTSSQQDASTSYQQKASDQDDPFLP